MLCISIVLVVVDRIVAREQRLGAPRWAVVTPTQRRIVAIITRLLFHRLPPFQSLYRRRGVVDIIYEYCNASGWGGGVSVGVYPLWSYHLRCC